MNYTLNSYLPGIFTGHLTVTMPSLFRHLPYITRKSDNSALCLFESSESVNQDTYPGVSVTMGADSHFHREVLGAGPQCSIYNKVHYKHPNLCILKCGTFKTQQDCLWTVLLNNNGKIGMSIYGIGTVSTFASITA